MIRMVTIALVLSFAGGASADGLTRHDEWLLALALLPTSEGLSYQASANLGARAGSGPLSAAFGVDAAMAWQLSECRALHVGGNLELATETSSGSAAIGFCIPMVVHTFELTFAIDHNIRPSLDGRAIGLRSRFSGFSFGLNDTLIAIRTPTAQHRVSRFEGTANFQSQNEREFFGWDFDMAVYQRASTSTDFVLDIVAAGVHGRRDTASAPPSEVLTTMTYELAPVRLNSLKVANASQGEIRLDFEAGLVMGIITEPPRDPTDPRTRSLPRVQMKDMFVDAAVELEREADTTRLKFTRTLEPTSEDSLLRDNRVEAEWRHDFRRHILSMGGFAALSSLIDKDGAKSSTTPTGGVRVGFVTNITDELRLILSAEQAYSFYGTLDGQRAITPQWASQIMAKLSIATFR